MEIDVNSNISNYSYLTSNNESGTSLSIKNLLFSLPVRRKEWYKNKRITMENIKNIVISFALIHPLISFCLINFTANGDKQNLISLRQNRNLKESIALIFGTNLAKSSCFFNDQNITFDEMQKILLSGCISLSHDHKLSKKCIYISFNRRPVDNDSVKYNSLVFRL